ncbi:uncharacterized protein LOC100113848 isoform X5 [Nasonia vitripennis]|uniref:Uncharacterized protein n=1 Tax=Nasonia vitripennis TaxID=7425 RepID=A0A7M7R0Z6_NASVI|nr:uncharacterized protein LOC100113848 isoform X5 [Nasonia vitripennis]
MIHYYCMSCKQQILYYTKLKERFRKQKNTCAICNAQCEITTKSKNYFMSVDLKYQLKMMFDSVEIKKEIFDFINKMDNRNNDEIAIRDIYDSELYKEINSDTNMKYITYNLSTDGAPLTKSGKRGFWLLQIILNCLPPKSRFKYSLICGMLTCTEEPNSDLANLYFNNFKEQAALLYNEGRKMPILFLANKMDLPDSLTTVKLVSGLGLDKIQNKPWHVRTTNAITGEGLQAAIEWFTDQIRDIHINKR